jgi:hypothetical protein
MMAGVDEGTCFSLRRRWMDTQKRLTAYAGKWGRGKYVVFWASGSLNACGAPCESDVCYPLGFRLLNYRPQWTWLSLVIVSCNGSFSFSWSFTDLPLLSAEGDCVGCSDPSCPHGWPADYCGVLSSSVPKQAWGKNSIRASRCGNDCTLLETYINDLEKDGCFVLTFSSEARIWLEFKSYQFEFRSGHRKSDWDYLWFPSVLQDSNFPFLPHYFYLSLFHIFVRK